MKLTRLHEKEWPRTNLTVLIKFYSLQSPGDKGTAGAAEPIRVPQTGGHLAFPGVCCLVLLDLIS